MANSNDLFGQARLKHEWAYEHINQFHAAWERFLKTDFCKLVVDKQAEGGQVSVRAVSEGMIPAELVLHSGDALHNLNCALDYAINELLGWKNTRVTFPRAKTREELERSFSTKGLDPCETCGRGGKGRGANAAIEEAVPGIGKFITDEIRPYKVAGGFIWPLNRLDNRDKHRLLIPVVIPQTLRNVEISDQNHNAIRIGELPINPGGVVNLASFGITNAEVKSYAEATAEIFFNEIGAVEGQPVIPTLLNMAQAVAETIKGIEEFALAAGWEPAG